MLVIIDTEKMPWPKLYDTNENGERTAVRAALMELVEQGNTLITCANCDVWKTNGYLDGYGICLRTRSLEHKTHFCSAGQPGLTLEEGG